MKTCVNCRWVACGNYGHNLPACTKHILDPSITADKRGGERKMKEEAKYYMIRMDHEKKRVIKLEEQIKVEQKAYEYTANILRGMERQLISEQDSHTCTKNVLRDTIERLTNEANTKALVADLRQYIVDVEGK